MKEQSDKAIIEDIKGLINLLISVEEYIEERILNEDSRAVLEKCYTDRLNCIWYITLCKYLLTRMESDNER